VASSYQHSFTKLPNQWADLGMDFLTAFGHALFRAHFVTHSLARNSAVTIHHFFTLLVFLILIPDPLPTGEAEGGVNGSKESLEKGIRKSKELISITILCNTTQRDHNTGYDDA
jgi:hypothetical protein